MTVDAARLRSDLEANGEFGKEDTEEGRGRTLLTGSDSDKRARNYFVSRLEDADLDVRIDSVGNIVGRWEPDSVHPMSDPVAAGSHLDSVPFGGIFDGPLGVYGALEAVRSLRDSAFEPSHPIEVVSFTEEEGTRFSAPLLGSKVAVGSMSVTDALEVTDEEGVSIRTALDGIGFHGKGRVDASRWDSWMELHVEQDRRLESTGGPVGVVTTITGITHIDVEIIGEANHAGATQMSERTDALAAAAEFVLDVEAAANRVVETESSTAVGTVGKVHVSPNGTNVIPGKVSMGVDVRDVDRAAMERIVAEARDSLSRLESERGVTTAFDRYFDLEPIPMSERCRKAAHSVRDIRTIDLHSGAGHDTMEIASVTDVGLLFAPSKDGLSHTPLEWTSWEDCANATAVLAHALRELSTS